MTDLNRRAVLAGLAAVSAVPLAACEGRKSIASADPMAGGLDIAGVAAIAASYAAATGDPVGDDVRQALFPDEFADVATLNAAVISDFRAGRLFVHEGWRLSYTEGQLFTILSRLPASA